MLYHNIYCKALWKVQNQTVPCILMHRMGYMEKNKSISVYLICRSNALLMLWMMYVWYIHESSWINFMAKNAKSQELCLASSQQKGYSVSAFCISCACSICSSMTSLLVHTVAQPIKWRFLPKNLSLLVIFVIGLVFTWVWGDKNRAQF